MREMKDSGVEWIGKIPKDWEICHFKNVVSLYTGNSIKDEEKDMYQDKSAAHAYIATKDIDAVFNTVDYDNGLYIKNDDLSFRIAPAQSSLMCIEGGSAGRKKAQINQSVSFVNKLCCFSGNKKVDSGYLYYFLNSPNYETEFSTHLTGLIGGVSVSVLKNIRYLIPPVVIQHRIANYLNKKCNQINFIIKKQKDIIEKLKVYKLSLITETVTKGLNPDVELKDSRIQGADNIPKHWVNTKLLSVLSMRVIDGPHESPKLFDDGIPYISANAIVNGKIDFTKMRGYISEEYCDICDQRYKPQKNDILMIKLGATTGQIAMVETDKRFNIWVPLAAIRCNDETDARFVYYSLQASYLIRQMELLWTYGTQQTLGVKTIERLHIILPPKNEQRGIAVFLDKECALIDNSIDKKQKMIERFISYKKSLIYEVVTGKKEI